MGCELDDWRGESETVDEGEGRWWTEGIVVV